MKAAFITEPGPVENLVFGESPNPEPGAGQVLVQVRAASVNRVDVFTREGSHGTRARPRHVPGLDLAGDVVARGIDAPRFEVGGRVMGTGAGGTYAELAVAEESNLVSIPEGLSYEEAAAAPTAFCAGWHCLVCKAGLQVGETVLVLAGGSGVGSAAVQIAKSASARVITTVGSDAKVEKAKAIGADEVIVRTREDVTARVQQLTGGEGVDLVYDHVGQATWESSIASLKVGGRYVTNGVTSGHLAQIHLGRLWTRDLSVLGTTMRVSEDLGTVTDLIGRGVLKPVIDRVVPLEEASRAHAVLESDEFFGKVVLRVTP
jgi:NADPH:quinone reductase-like Zn-dependent oxidoreductase